MNDEELSFVLWDSVPEYGDSLQGHTPRLSYREMVSLFGEPNQLRLDYDHKVSTTWTIRFTSFRDPKDGVLTLYDYMQTCLFDRSLPSVSDFRRDSNYYAWHIGCLDREAEDLLRRVLALIERHFPASVRKTPKCSKIFIGMFHFFIKE